MAELIYEIYVNEIENKRAGIPSRTDLNTLCLNVVSVIFD
jgi:hypothetical protein